MRAVVQRVSEARALVGGTVLGRIGPGLCILLGISRRDTEASARKLAQKIRNLRIFDDMQSRMNRSLADGNGAVLVVSQFTLYGDCSKGNRPSFTDAAPADAALKLYREFVGHLEASGIVVATGQFQAHMSIALVNDGPVTLIVEA
jgi:D-tyrosyl-tRNA(Tyr) deacylase